MPTLTTIASFPATLGAPFGSLFTDSSGNLLGVASVRPPGGVERLVKEPGIASVAAHRLDRQLPLVSDGQREEGVRLGEGFGDQLGGDAVIDDVEEAHGAARRADLSSDRCQRGAVTFGR